MTAPASVVQGMTVAEVRKALLKIRTMWLQSSASNPLFTSEILVGPLDIANFCTQFSYGHHIKRHYKSAQLRDAGLDSNCSNDFDVTGGGGDEYSPWLMAFDSGIAGPKGDVADPFPFTLGWKPAVANEPSEGWWNRKPPADGASVSVAAPPITSDEVVDLWKHSAAFPSQETIADRLKPNTRKRGRT